MLVDQVIVLSHVANTSIYSFHMAVLVQLRADIDKVVYHHGLYQVSSVTLKYPLKLPVTVSHADPLKVHEIGASRDIC